MVLPFIRPPRASRFQHPPEHLLVRRRADQPPRSRNGHVIRRALVQPDAQKFPQSERICHPPGDASFAVDALEKADHHQPEVDPWRQRRPSEVLMVELAAAPFTETVEAFTLQQIVQASVERMARCLRQLASVPQRFLSLPLLACSHRHGSILRQNISNSKCF